MKFEDTILSRISLEVLSRGATPSLPSLLSAARSEFFSTHGHDGPHMTKLTELFREIAKIAYASEFVWSRYNLDQWDKFVASEASAPEGGSCVFSCEEDGGYSGKIHSTFKALFVGVPTGMYPYSISVHHGIAKMDTNALRAWITARGHRVA